MAPASAATHSHEQREQPFRIHTHTQCAIPSCVRLSVRSTLQPDSRLRGTVDKRSRCARSISSSRSGCFVSPLHGHSRGDSTRDDKGKQELLSLRQQQQQLPLIHEWLERDALDESVRVRRVFSSGASRLGFPSPSLTPGIHWTVHSLHGNPVNVSAIPCHAVGLRTLRTPPLAAFTRRPSMKDRKRLSP